MPRNLLVGATLACLVPIAEKWLWKVAGLPPMKWWQKSVLMLMTMAAITVWYGWHLGWEEIWPPRGLLPALGGLLFVAALFAAFFIPYESRHDSVSNGTRRP